MNTYIPETPYQPFDQYNPIDILESTYDDEEKEIYYLITTDSGELIESCVPYTPIPEVSYGEWKNRPYSRKQG